MEIGDRIKELRKHLQLTQADFGERIGLKPTAIGQMEGSTRNVTDRTVILISEKYNVNKDWLLSGSGEMFIKPSTFSLDEYAKSQDLNENEINLIRGFMELDPATRNALFNMFSKSFTNDVEKEITATRPTKENNLSNEIDALEEEYKKNVLKNVSKKGVSVSNITEGTTKKEA